MKIIYKIFFIFIITIANIVSVKAIDEQINIERILIDDQSQTINVNIPSYDKNDIDSKIVFKKKGDYVKYIITLKNNTGKTYTIKDIEDNVDSEYINVSYNYDDKEFIDTIDIYVTVEYIDEVYSEELVYNLNDILLKIRLVDITGETNENNEVLVNINPNAGDNIKTYGIILLLSLILLVLLIKYKRKSYLLLIILLFGTICYVKAESKEEVIISFKNNSIKVDTNKFIDITNEELGINKDNVENIYFVTRDKLPDNVEGSFDISKNRDNQTIEYYVKNGQNYDLYIISSDEYSKYNSKDLTKLFCKYTNLKTIDLSYLDLSSVNNMYGMFTNDKKLENIIWPDNLDTSKVIDMAYLFANCNMLSEIDLSKFDTSNVMNMKYMFFNCSKLTELDVSNFDTSNVTSMKTMFYKCSELTKLDVSKFDTSNVEDMSYMFTSCSNLTNLDVSNFNTENVNNMTWMFGSCTGLEYLDVSNFNTEKVTSMYAMFYECKLIPELDISSFNLENVENTKHMFMKMESLKTIYANENFKINENAETNYMFLYDKMLVGGNGTTYNESYINATYARIDTEETPGYFTKK